MGTEVAGLHLVPNASSASMGFTFMDLANLDRKYSENNHVCRTHRDLIHNTELTTACTRNRGRFIVDLYRTCAQHTHRPHHFTYRDMMEFGIPRGS